MTKAPSFAKSLMSDVARVKEEFASERKLAHGGVHGMTLRKACLEKENRIPNLKDGIEVLYPDTKEELKELLLSSNGGRNFINIYDVIMCPSTLDIHIASGKMLLSNLDLNIEISMDTFVDFLWRSRIEHLN